MFGVIISSTAETIAKFQWENDGYLYIYIYFVCMEAHTIYRIINILWSWVNKIDLYRYVLEVCLHFKNQISIFDTYFVFINHRDESQDYFDKVRISDFPKRYMLE